MTAYRFLPSTEYVLAQLLALDDARQAQVVQGVAAFLGGNHADVVACMEAIAQMEGASAAQVPVWRYEIVREGETTPCYEMWTFGGGDDGLVFPYRDDAATAVHCAQGGFWSVDDEDSDAIALAEALERAAPF